MEMIGVAMVVIAYYFHKEISELIKAISIHFLKGSATKDTYTTINNYHKNPGEIWPDLNDDSKEGNRLDPDQGENIENN